jgi:hypothetical protein
VACSDRSLAEDLRWVRELASRGSFTVLLLSARAYPSCSALRPHQGASPSPYKMPRGQRRRQFWQPRYPGWRVPLSRNSPRRPERDCGAGSSEEVDLSRTRTDNRAARRSGYLRTRELHAGLSTVAVARPTSVGTVPNPSSRYSMLAHSVFTRPDPGGPSPLAQHEWQVHKWLWSFRNRIDDRRRCSQGSRPRLAIDGGRRTPRACLR